VKHICIASLLAVSALGGATTIFMTAAAAAPTKPLYPKATRTLKFDRTIGRVEIDREGVIAVRAPNARSLLITGIGAGEAMLTVHAADGSLLASGPVTVAQPPSSAAGAIAADPRLVDVSAVRVGTGVTLSGNADSLDARNTAERLAANAGEGAVTNSIALNSEQVVAVDVQFAAVSTNTLKALGFSFSKLTGDIQGAVVSPSSLASFAFAPGLSLATTAPLQNAFNLFLAGPNRGIGAVLSALSSNGLSQLLAEPTLLVRSGEQAHFLAGGEIPIPVPQTGGSGTGGGTVTIQYKEFGVRLTVAPFVLSKDRIVLKIAPEVSELDYNNGVQIQGFTVPGIRRRSAETTVQLGSGQSFVIAGLTYNNTSITKDKLPFLGDLPVLGAFFKRQQSQKERQELIIVATPRLVGPMEAGTVPPLPGSSTASLDPTIGEMIMGTDGLEQRTRPFGVVRR
jgi:pilus assembly protein CpaC